MIRVLALLAMLSGIANSQPVSPNDRCKYAFTLYFDPEDLGPAILKDCKAADCDTIKVYMLANTAALRAHVDTVRDRETYLAVQANGEWCLQNNYSPTSAPCLRDLDERMAVVNKKHQTGQSIANDYQRQMTPYYLDMVNRGACYNGTTGLANRPKAAKPLFRFRYDLAGRHLK